MDTFGERTIGRMRLRVKRHVDAGMLCNLYMHILLVVHAIRASKGRAKPVLTSCLERISRPDLLGGIQLKSQFSSCIAANSTEHVETYVKSLTHSVFGRSALNFRFT